MARGLVERMVFEWRPVVEHARRLEGSADFLNSPLNYFVFPRILPISSYFLAYLRPSSYSLNICIFPGMGPPGPAWRNKVLADSVDDPDNADKPDALDESDKER